MTSTYMGLALAANSAGTFDVDVVSPGADNCLAVVVTDSSTVTSGYLQAVFSSITTSSDASYTTGSSQVAGFASDIFIGGTMGCEVHGFASYITKSGTPVSMASAQPACFMGYIDDLGAAPTTRACARLHIADGNAGSVNDAFIIMRIEGSSGAVTCMFEKAGTATNPTYFLKTNAVDGMIVAGDFITSAVSAYGLAVYVNGAARYIPLVTNT